MLDKEDSVLLSLHRQYSKEECVEYLFQRLLYKDMLVQKLKDELDLLGQSLIQEKKKSRNLSTQLGLIKRYFKVKMDRNYGLFIKERVKQLI